MTHRPNLPSTSHDANRLATAQMRDAHKAKILAAIEKLGSATADKVSEVTGMSHEQVNRRFSELARDEKIYNTKLKSPTRRGRDAYVWTTVKNKTVNSVVDDMISNATKKDFIQKELFNDCPETNKHQ